MAYGLLTAFRAGDRQVRGLGYACAGLFLAFFVDGLFGFNLRVPVSAAVFFLMLAIAELVWRREGVLATQTGVGLRVAATGLAVITLLMAVQSGRVFASEYQMHRGMSLQAAGEYQTARLHLQEGERLAPWNGHFQRRLGDGALAERKLEAARTHFERALALYPDYFLSNLPLTHTLILLAQSDPNRPMEERLRLLQEGAMHAQAILDIVPQFARAEAALGHIGFLSAALISTSPSPALASRADAYWEQAETHIERAINFGAEDPDELYRMLAQTRIAMKKFPEAEEALVRAAQSAPNAQETWPVFLDFARKHNRYDRLRDTLYAQIVALRENAEEEADALAMAHLLLANVLENGYKDLEGAATAYGGAVEYGPSLPAVWANFARFALAHDQITLLETFVEQAAARLADAGERLPAQLAIVKGVLDDGAAALYPATATLTANVRAQGAGADLTAEQAFGWVALYLLHAVQREEDSDVCGSLLNLGMAFNAMVQPATAERLYERAARCLPEEELSFLFLHRALNLAALDRMNDALAVFAEGRERFPDDVEMRWAYARLLAQAGMVDGARQEYRELLAEEGLDPTGRAMLQSELNQLTPPNP